MKAYITDFILVTFISLSLLLLRSQALAASKQFQATVYNTMNSNASICHDGFISVYISKVQFADLPFTIYVQGKSDTKKISCWWWHMAFECLCLLFFFLCPNSHKDVHSGYHQAIAVAKQCHYFLRETDTFIILTVASNGCFVRREVSWVQSVSVCRFFIQIYNFFFIFYHFCITLFNRSIS